MAIGDGGNIFKRAYDNGQTSFGFASDLVSDVIAARTDSSTASSQTQTQGSSPNQIPQGSSSSSSQTQTQTQYQYQSIHEINIVLQLPSRGTAANLSDDQSFKNAIKNVIANITGDDVTVSISSIIEEPVVEQSPVGPGGVEQQQPGSSPVTPGPGGAE